MNKERPHTIPAPEGSRVTPEEIQDVMADEGYTADQRKGRLKEILTQISGAQDDPSETQRLKAEIEEIIAANQDDEPQAEEPRQN